MDDGRVASKGIPRTPGSVGSSSGLRQAQKTVSPFSRRRFTVADPMPEVPPAIRIDLLISRKDVADFRALELARVRVR